MKLATALLLPALLLAAVPSRGADDSPDPKALLDRAIARHGGKAALQALPDLETRGMFETSGRFGARTLPIVLEERGDGAYRHETTFERRGRKVTIAEFYDGKVCKRRFGSGGWDDLPLDEARERAAHRISFLLAAAGREAKLAGEGSEAGIDVWRVQVPDGRGTATLSLAKDDARLVALEFPGIEAEGMGTKKEVVRKAIWRDLRKVGDLLLPFDVELLKDGSPEGRYRFERVERLKAFDESWLRIPDPRRSFIPGEELAN